MEKDTGKKLTRKRTNTMHKDILTTVNSLPERIKDSPAMMDVKYLAEEAFSRISMEIQRRGVANSVGEDVSRAELEEYGHVFERDYFDTRMEVLNRYEEHFLKLAPGPDHKETDTKNLGPEASLESVKNLAVSRLEEIKHHKEKAEAANVEVADARKIKTDTASIRKRRKVDPGSKNNASQG